MDLDRLRHIERRVNQGVFVRKDIREVIKALRDRLNAVNEQPAQQASRLAAAKQLKEWAELGWVQVHGKIGETYYVGYPVVVDKSIPPKLVSGNAIIKSGNAIIKSTC